MKMELWIRSQDRTILRKVNTIGIVEGRDFWSIDENLTVSFGKYKTKERALEVLDEIQNILKPKIIIKFDNKPKYLEDGTINDVLTPREEIDYSKQLSTYVYEMPEN